MTRHQISAKKLACYFLTMALSSSCGTSIFSLTEKKDPAEDATVLMEKDKTDEAIKILNRALAKDPENYQLISLLSSATAQKFGIDTINIALEMAKNASKTAESGTSSAAGSNGITALFAALPAATTERIDGIKEAIRIMETIPIGLRTESDNFKLTMMHTAVLGLVTKQFDKDGDGLVSPVEKLNITPEDAVTILSSLLSAQETMALGTGANGASSSASLENISKIQDAINSSEGATDQEKLLNYLNSTGTTPPTTTTTLPTTLPPATPAVP